MGCDTASADAVTAPVQPAVSAGEMPRPSSVLSLQRLQILCVLSADGRFDRAKLQAELCEAAAVAARRGASLPVEVIGTGDPKLLDPAALSLLVHASLTEVAGEAVLTATARGYRPGRVEAELFGPAPVVVPIGDSFATASREAMLMLVPPLLP